MPQEALHPIKHLYEASFVKKAYQTHLALKICWIGTDHTSLWLPHGGTPQKIRRKFSQPVKPFRKVGYAESDMASRQHVLFDQHHVTVWKRSGFIFSW